MVRRRSTLLTEENSNAADYGTSVTATLPESIGAGRSRRPQDLTPRERQILQLVWEGYTSRLIADRLGISIKTAEAHRANMMKKLRATNTAQLVKAAFEAGLIKTSGAEQQREEGDRIRESVA